MQDPAVQSSEAADVRPRGRIVILVAVVVVAVVAGYVIYRFAFAQPKVADVCEHVEGLPADASAQHDLDGAMAAIPAASNGNGFSEGDRCLYYFTSVRDIPRYGGDYNKRASCALEAKTRADVARCLQ